MKGDLADELLQDRFPEALEIIGCDHESVRAADDFLPIIKVEALLHPQDRQSVDRDAGCHRVSSRLGDISTIVAPAISRDVDDAPCRAAAAFVEQPDRKVDRAHREWTGRLALS